ncbi:Hypothetical predicted protein [Paramuricea clavata]|uniref:Uncharacterized protein n=1 Tax=Paramuricea clavata TaxID=317549 RepID=A0A7D9HFQ2_PARCT|nr:Hypothetical predicted protein [Paramuricea clavata]
MTSATYLILTYLIPLLYGQLDAAVPSNSTQSHLAASPSGKMSQPSSNIHLQPSLITSEVKSPIQSFIGRTTTSLKSSQPVLNTAGNPRNNFSSTGTVPMPSLTLNESGVYSSSYPIMVQPSKQLTSSSDIIADSGQLSTWPTTQEVTSTTISQSLIVITSSSPNILLGNVTASTASKLSVSVQNNNHSIHILVSPALETPSNNISRSSSISKVKPGLTSSPNGLPIPSVSKVNMTSSSSNVKLRSSNVTPSPTSSKMKLNQTSSSTAVPNLSSSNVKLRSPNVTPSATSSKMKLNQTSSSTVVPNLSSSNVKLKPNSSTMVISHPSSVQYIPNISSTHSINVTSSPVITVKPTSASQVVQTAISAAVALNSSHLVKSMMSSPPLSSITSTVFPTSVLSPYNRSSFTVTIEASCNNLLACSITLQPSATMQYTSMGSGTALSSSLSNILNRNASSFMSSSVSGMNTSSVLHREKTTQAPGSEDKEKSHTPLIIGLAVGLSLGMVLIIVIIVYYRRKRSSYQYNVFYDEQNIVMHPFDYSK